MTGKPARKANALYATVQAAVGGTVELASWQLPWGNLVVIDHGAEYKTYYAQLDSIAVERGQLIVRTQSIGKVGSTGHATSAQLHFEVGRRRCSASRSVSCCSRTSTLQGP